MQRVVVAKCLYGMGCGNQVADETFVVEALWIDKMRNVEHPKDLEWIEGDLPTVDRVPTNCWALAWMVFGENPTGMKKNDDNSYSPEPRPDLAGKFRRITMVHPHGDKLNPIRWCDSSQHPIGYEEAVKYFAWIK
jgi:hypothetical protein